MYCTHCGTQLMDGSNYCTKCGGAVGGVMPQQAGPAPVESTSQRLLLPVGRTPLSLVAGYLGLASMLIIFLGPVAMILGILAWNDLKKQPEMWGRGRAIFAIIIGTLTTVATLFFLYLLMTEA